MYSVVSDVAASYAGVNLSLSSNDAGVRGMGTVLVVLYSVVDTVKNTVGKHRMFVCSLSMFILSI
jgi:hypothetical protein